MGAVEVSSTGGSAQTLATREFGRDELDIIRNVIAKGATDVELKMFVVMAGKLGLDPLSKQIHFVKRKARQGEDYVDVVTITVGIDGYRLVAERTGRYCPGRAPTYEYDAQGRLVSATAYVLKLAGGAWHEVSAVAFWQEYAQMNKDGKPTAMWARMPRLMLGKCAEALALRRAFPAELSGVYTEDEMAQSANEPAPRVPVDAHAPIDADVVQRPAIAAPKQTVQAAPKSIASVADEAWRVELRALGLKAKSIIDTVADLPDDQREQLTQAMALAREALAANGHGTPEQRAAAAMALKMAIGVKEEPAQA